MALYFECQINKNALFRTFFLPILPVGTRPFLLCSLSFTDYLTLERLGRDGIDVFSFLWVFMILTDDRSAGGPSSSS